MKATVFAMCLVVVASSCSLGPKEEWAETIHAAAERGRSVRTAEVRMTASVKAIETTLREELKPLITPLIGHADFRKRLARMVGVTPSKRVVYFDDLSVYLPRSAFARKERDGVWARFDFGREPSEDIDDTDRAQAVGAGLISPVIALEVLEGVLTGSIEREGEETRLGGRVTHYSGRISRDAAAREISDEDRREGFLRLFETLGVQDDIFSVDVWLDDDDRARVIRFGMRQQKDRVNAFDLKLTYEYVRFGHEAPIKVPLADATIAHGRFRDFVRDFPRDQA